jgi:hypothetical protein
MAFRMAQFSEAISGVLELVNGSGDADVDA